VAAVAGSLDLFVVAGIPASHDNEPPHLGVVAPPAGRVPGGSHELVERGEKTGPAGRRLPHCLGHSRARAMCPPSAPRTRYLERFAKGVTFAQARHEVQQFSVFAAQFDVAQAKLVANAPTLEAYTERLNVLLNEKGIPYGNGFEGELNGQWSMDTVHFTWMR